MIPATENAFKITNSRVVENIFTGENSIFFEKLVRDVNKVKLYYKKHY